MVEYTKVIHSGNTLEIYQYEKAPKVSANRTRKRIPKTPDSGGFEPPDSKRWDNIRRARKGFIRLVQANCAGDLKPALVTLTMRSVVEIPEASKCYTRFAQRLKKNHGPSIRYIGVPEFQKRGAVHYHILIWGLPDNVIQNERHTRYLQNCWGYGYVDCKATDGSPKLAGYLAKYMSKSMSDVRLLGKRAYNASANVLRPVLFKTAVVADYTKMIWGVDKEVLTDKEFGTEWLGRCRYRLIRLTPITDG